MTKKGEKPIEREYQARGISAHPDWWQAVEQEAEEMGLNRSAFIRMAVNDYLKKGMGSQSEAKNKELALA